MAKTADEYDWKEYKEWTHDTWNKAVGAYQRVLLGVLEPYSQPLLDLARIRPGMRVLDVATGPGEPALSIARLVGPQGKVVGIDLSENMAQAAQATARERGLANVEFRAMDAERLEFPDAHFDVVLSRFGIQIFTDPDRHFEEARRVLQPGGRAAYIVWTDAERAKGVDITIAASLKHNPPPPGEYVPTPYEMGGRGELAAALREHGFEGVEERAAPLDWVLPSPEAYVEGIWKGTPLGDVFDELSPAKQAAIRHDLRKGVEAWRTPQGDYRIPTEAVAAAGGKPR
jgi:ubiquinone/menaquinone biosynthesis C-methylase UbiE